MVELAASAAGPATAVTAWLEANRPAVERFLLVLDDIRAGGQADLTTLSVAMREARALGAVAGGRSAG